MNKQHTWCQIRTRSYPKHVQTLPREINKIYIVIFDRCYDEFDIYTAISRFVKNKKYLHSSWAIITKVWTKSYATYEQQSYSLKKIWIWMHWASRYILLSIVLSTFLFITNRHFSFKWSFWHSSWHCFEFSYLLLSVSNHKRYTNNTFFLVGIANSAIIVVLFLISCKWEVWKNGDINYVEFCLLFTQGLI